MPVYSGVLYKYLTSMNILKYVGTRIIYIYIPTFLFKVYVYEFNNYIFVSATTKIIPWHYSALPHIQNKIIKAEFVAIPL